MKYLVLVSLLTFSLSSFADDLSFGSFSVEEKASVSDQASTDISFASFDLSDESEGRAVASVEEAPTPSVDPIAFGSFE